MITYNKKTNSIYTSQKGFALLIGVLISSVLLAITMVMFNITLKQISLSTVGRDSQIALYAADTGLECALYWDLKGDGNNSQFVREAVNGSINCVNAQNPTITTNSQMTADGTLSKIGGMDYCELPTFTTDATLCPVAATNIFQLTLDGTSCAIIRIYKAQDAQGNVKTKIASRGYNTCTVNSPQRLERGLEVHY